ncbi:DUF4184 family protein [Pontibacter beigongshangensis]|uniref:DUF4184 family protein n=1 Tax=Pontibacter beigongshangensis TaxID=2574733 RepID=UPI00164FEFE8|nr:DUF4184 family protein [Pontibacter beigongshangensis]
MPFTFSHPAIVLPLHALPAARRSMTGLIVGSIVPDFEMFLKMKAVTSFSHTLAGVFWFNLPLALLLCFVYHLLVRDTLIANLPRFLRLRLTPLQDFNWTAHFKKHYLVVIVSILLGIVLHILWDGFTHKNGYFVKLLPYLLTTVELGGWTAPLYYLLQLGFSVLGLWLVLLAVFLLPAQQEQNSKGQPKIYWTIIAVFTSLLFLAGMQQEIVSNYIANVLVILISAGSVALVTAPVLLKIMGRLKAVPK